jgi:hypothetical protein
MEKFSSSPERRLSPMVKHSKLKFSRLKSKSIDFSWAEIFKTIIQEGKIRDDIFLVIYSYY